MKKKAILIRLHYLSLTLSSNKFSVVEDSYEAEDRDKIYKTVDQPECSRGRMKYIIKDKVEVVTQKAVSFGAGTLLSFYIVYKNQEERDVMLQKLIFCIKESLSLNYKHVTEALLALRDFDSKNA